MKKVVGYANAWSVMPGDTLSIMVSTYGAERYRADLVRVICGDDDPDHGIYREAEIAAPFNGEYPGRTQPTFAGSYVIVPDVPAIAAPGSFTVQAWVFPTTPDRGEQGLIANWIGETASGFALLIDDAGALAMRLGDGNGDVAQVSTGRPLAARRWHLVAAAYDAATRELRVFQEPIETPLEVSSVAGVTSGIAFDVAANGGAPLVMAALPAAHPAGGPGARHHFNGKIDRPRLTGRALSRAEIAALAWDAQPHERDTSVIASWDFARDIGGDRISDLGPNRAHGRAVNLPSRAVKGFNWSGAEQNWRHAPQEYGAIHFHDDDHYDVGWEADFDYEVPEDTAVRLTERCWL